MSPSNKIRDFYLENPRMVSSPFGGIEGINDDLFGEILDSLSINLEGCRVLDVGCGRGHAENSVRLRGGRYIGADFCVSRTGFSLAQSDAAHLPFPDATFDALFCVDAFEHFPCPQSVATEFYRVLRPGGVFFLSAPNYANVAGLVKWYCEHFAGYAKGSWAPFGRWQPQELEQALTPALIRRIFSGAGFTALHALAYGPEVGLGLFPWIDHPNTPEAIQYRLQRLFKWVGPTLAKLFPTLSLHLFWRMEKPSSSRIPGKT